MRCLPVVALLLSPLALGCIADDKGPEEELLDDGKADSFRKPTDHGALAFATRATAALTTDERYHTWTFELTGDARVDMTTSYAVLGQRRTDTVLYLYREAPGSVTGWGAYIARNDDYGTTTYSQLVRELGAGRYRVLVKGYAADTRGKFSLTVGCDGAGCAAPASCLFGDYYYEIPDAEGIDVIHRTKITAANLDTLSTADQAKLVRAVQQSSHTDVTTPGEALARVDQNEVNLSFISEPAARRMFMAFEYGAGDNSYGAIFERQGDAMVSKINDGDLLDCTVQRETCLLPADWSALRMDPSFTRTAARVVTAASELSALEQAQAVGAFRMSYDDVSSAAEGLARIDGGELDVQAFRHTTGAEVTVLAYYAGDTSVGAIYFAGTTNLAGAINDLAIERCNLFAR